MTADIGWGPRAAARTLGRVWKHLLLVTALVWAGACSPSEEPGQPSPSASTASASPSPPVVSPSPSPSPVFLGGTNARAAIAPSGVIVPVLESRSDGAIVGTPCGNRALLPTGLPLDGATVILDPGHGGRETGSVGANGLPEKQVNLAVASFTKQALEATGASVVLTRSGDYRITLLARAAIAKSLAPKAFVSIHHNGDADGPRPGPGTETFYQTRGAAAEASKRLAGLIYEEVVAALSKYPGIPWVGDRDAGAKYRKSSSGDDYYGILRHTQGTPAAISEAAFMSNPKEAELLASPEVQKAEAEAIARAITRFITTSDPGSGFVEPYPRRQPAGSGGGSAGCVDPPL